MRQCTFGNEEAFGQLADVVVRHEVGLARNEGRARLAALLVVREEDSEAGFDVALFERLRPSPVDGRGVTLPWV